MERNFNKNKDNAFYRKDGKAFRAFVKIEENSEAKEENV